MDATSLANDSKWLQSKYQVELFDRFFVQFGPTFVQALSPLVVLSVSATVSASFKKHVRERLEWLKICFESIAPNVSTPQVDRSSH